MNEQKSIAALMANLHDALTIADACPLFRSQSHRMNLDITDGKTFENVLHLASKQAITDALDAFEALEGQLLGTGVSDGK